MADLDDEINGQRNPSCSQTQFDVKSYGSGPNYIGDGTTVNVHEDKRTTCVVHVHNINIQVQQNADDKKGICTFILFGKTTKYSMKRNKRRNVQNLFRRESYLFVDMLSFLVLKSSYNAWKN